MNLLARLSSISERLVTGPSRRPARPGAGRHDCVRFAAAAVVESLEQRRLLAAPQIGPLPFDPVAPEGRSLFVPITTTDADGDAVELSATVAGPEPATVAFLPRDNTFLQMDVQGFGSMLFQLYDNIAPETARRISGLANSGWYDGLQIPRVEPGFVFQFGSPNNDLTGGPDFTFGDEFDPDVLYTGTGQLAMANSGRDTNGSQVFVTQDDTRFLDGRHTVFGQLVRGWDVNQAIMNVPIVPRPGTGTQMPSDPIFINQVRSVSNDTDGVLRFRANSPGTYTVTVTATDATGLTTTRDFTFEVAAETATSPAVFLPFQDAFVTPADTAITFDVPAADPQDRPLVYDVGILSGDTDGSVTVNEAAQTVTYTPSPGYTGPVEIVVRVGAEGTTFEEPLTAIGGVWDRQVVHLGVGDSTASGNARQIIALRNIELGNAVLATFTDSAPGGTPSTWTAEIDWGDGTVTPGTVQPGADANTFIVRGAHTFSQTAEQLPLLVRILGQNGARHEFLSGLDVRRMVEFDAATGTMRVNGSSADDVMRFRLDGENFRATVNGATDAVNRDVVHMIEIFGYDGDDDIRVTLDDVGVRIFGIAGNNTIFGGGGNDEIFGGTGNDFIDGGPGNDYIEVGSGNNYVMGGTGFEVTEEMRNRPGGWNRDTIVGGPGNDTLSGGLDRNTIFGVAGNNLINGSGARDYLEGGTGNDTIRGWGNDDTLVSGEGDNLLQADGVAEHPTRGTYDLEAHAGNNHMTAGPGFNRLFGGFGNDTLVSGPGPDFLDGFAGTNTGVGIDEEEDEWHNIDIFE